MDKLNKWLLGIGVGASVAIFWLAGHIGKLTGNRTVDVCIFGALGVFVAAIGISAKMRLKNLNSRALAGASEIK